MPPRPPSLPGRRTPLGLCAGLVAAIALFASLSCAQDLRVELRVVATPSSVDRMTDAQFQGYASAAQINLGSSYAAEVWLRETATPSAGITGGSVDLSYDTAFTEATALNHGTIFTELAIGAIVGSSRLIDNLGGATFNRLEGSAGWVRLAWAQFTALQKGNVNFQLARGIAQFSRVGLGNVDWTRVQFGPGTTIEIAEGVTTCLSPAPGLVAWWPGDGDASDIVGPNTGSLGGGAFFAAGRVGRGFGFDSDDDRVTVPPDAFLNAQSPGFTVEFWVRAAKSAQPGSTAQILDKSQGADATGWGFVASKDTGAVGFTMGNGTSYATVTSTADLLDNQFHHVAGTWSGAVLALYVDGVAQGQAPVANPAGNSRPLNFGFAANAGSPSRFFRGLLDEVAIYQRSLSSTEIGAVFLAGGAGKCRTVPPTIHVQPTSQTVAEGGQVAFSVRATGSLPLSYQWRVNGVPLASTDRITGVASATLALTQLRSTDAGDYTVVIANTYNSVTSSVAVLTVAKLPSITVQPQSRTNNVGTTARLSVTALGTEPLAYQWKFKGNLLANGDRISGATSPTLTIANVQVADAGSYSVLVTNAYGVATSADALLTVITNPPVTDFRLIAATGSGTGHPFALVELQTNPVAEILIGATSYSPALDFSPAGELYGASTELRTLDPATGAVRQRIGSLRSAEATVLLARSIAFAPDGRLFALIDGDLYQVNPATAFATRIGPVQGANVWGIDFAADGTLYGAQFDLVTIDPVTGQVLATIGHLAHNVVDIDCAPDGSIYAVQYSAKQLYRIDPANAASVTVGTYESAIWGIASENRASPAPPTITGQPQNATAHRGSTVSFAVTATGAGPLTYQWYKDGVPLVDNPRLSGATNVTLTVSSVQAADQGSYHVVVANPYGSTPSNPAVLTVQDCAPAPSGLVGWWPGNGTADDLLGLNHAALAGGAFFSPAHVGNGFTFDSNDDRATVAYSPGFDLRSPGFTIECWVRGTKSQPESIAALIDKSHGFVDSTGWAIQVTTGNGLAGVAVGNGTSFPSVTGNRDVLDGAFHHLAATWDGNSLQFFVDGVLQGSTAMAAPANNNRALNFGFAWGGGTPQRCFRGSLDEISIYSRALSAAEIAAVVAAGTAGKCPSIAPFLVQQPADRIRLTNATVTLSVTAGGSPPLAYQWYKDGAPITDDARVTGATTSSLRLTSLQPSDAAAYRVSVSNPAGTTNSSLAFLTVLKTEPASDLIAYYPFTGGAADASGHGNDASVIGARLAAGHQGQPDTAYAFNGSGDYLDCGPSPSLNYLTNFTISAWVNLNTAGGGYRPILSKQTLDGGGNGRAEFNLQVQTSGNLNFFMGDGGSGHSYGVLLNGGNLQAQQWQHVAVTCENQTVTLYLDGQAKASGTYTAATRPFGTLPLQIGRFNNGAAQFFQGSIDEVRVHQRALTPAEIQALMVATDGLIIGEAPVWGWARGAGGSGATNQSRAITAGTNGRITVTGAFQQTTRFGSTPLTTTAPQDVFTVQYDNQGTLVWAGAGGANPGSYTTSITESGFGAATDFAGNTYVVGAFVGTLFSGVHQLTSPSEGTEIFLAKYDATGTLVWTRRAGGTGWDAAYGVAVDDTGDVYLTGMFASGTAQFGNLTLTRAGGTDVFVAKYTSAGSPVWAQAAGGGANDVGYAIVAAPDGTVGVTGYCQGKARFGPNTEVQVEGTNAVFVARYAANSGTLAWVQTSGGTTSSAAGYGLAATPTGNLLVAGMVQGSTSFGQTNVTPPTALQDAFLACYDAAGQLTWVRTGGCSQGYGRGVVLDSAGGVYLAGFFRGTANLRAGILTSPGTSDFFVAAYDLAGSLRWARAGGNTNALISGLAADPSGHLYVTGQFSGTAAFGPDRLQSVGASDLFVARLESTMGPVITAPPASLNLGLGATAVLQVEAQGDGPLTYRWYKDGVALTDDPRTTGTTTARLTINKLQATDAGAYVVVITGPRGSTSSAPAYLTLGGQELRLEIEVVNQQCHLILRAETGRTYEIEVTDNPAMSWRTAATLNVTQPGQVWVDPAPPNERARYYRLKRP